MSNDNVLFTSLQSNVLNSFDNMLHTAILFLIYSAGSHNYIFSFY